MLEAKSSRVAFLTFEDIEQEIKIYLWLRKEDWIKYFQWLNDRKKIDPEKEQYVFKSWFNKQIRRCFYELRNKKYIKNETFETDVGRTRWVSNASQFQATEEDTNFYENLPDKKNNLTKFKTLLLDLNSIIKKKDIDRATQLVVKGFIDGFDFREIDEMYNFPLDKSSGLFRELMAKLHPGTETSIRWEVVQAKRKEYKKQYHIDNAEIEKEKRLKYYQENKEKMNRKSREYKANNEEKIRLYNKEYQRKLRAKNKAELVSV